MKDKKIIGEIWRCLYNGYLYVCLNYPTRPGRMGIPMGCPTSLVQLMSIPQGKHTCPGWHMERFPCGVMSDIPVHPVPCQSIQLSRTERLVSISESFLSYLLLFCTLDDAPIIRLNEGVSIQTERNYANYLRSFMKII